ncbi:6841_t:CDS:2 [Racocetra fulgida]|uniref:6841_t:CDS:1 n=1 Tax=Racocetra fulgida TaxID=60492 RepID=A0A9N8WGL9_9GLOM|nr:6841_t:CDS:2 [Racocetra fulgida]
MIIKNGLPVQTEGWENVAPTIVQAIAIQLTDTEAQCQNLAKKLCLSQENKLLEQLIMKYYTKCVYTAIARCQNPTIDNPTDNDLFFIQTEEVIAHLSNKYSNCWPKVCWISTNSDIELETPNLKLYHKSQKEQLLNFLCKIIELKGN